MINLDDTLASMTIDIYKLFMRCDIHYTLAKRTGEDLTYLEKTHYSLLTNFYKAFREINLESVSCKKAQDIKIYKDKMDNFVTRNIISI